MENELFPRQNVIDAFHSFGYVLIKSTVVRGNITHCIFHKVSSAAGLATVVEVSVIDVDQPFSLDKQALSRVLGNGGVLGLWFWPDGSIVSECYRKGMPGKYWSDESNTKKVSYQTAVDFFTFVGWETPNAVWLPYYNRDIVYMRLTHRNKKITINFAVPAITKDLKVNPKFLEHMLFLCSELNGLQDQTVNHVPTVLLLEDGGVTFLDLRQ